MRKITDPLLHLNNLRKAAGFSFLVAGIRSKVKLQSLEHPPKGNILVFSPHPDDDVFGCGGTIKLHVDQGDKVKILYFTNKNTIRETEAQNATKILGVQNIQFLDFAEGQIAPTKDHIAILTNLINEFKPQAIYLPSFLDPHPDHFDLCQLFFETLKHSDYDGEIVSYEIWTPIYINRLVDVTATFESKKNAIAEHKSQLADRNYADAFEGLAKYRAGTFNAGQYAEGFFTCKKELYTQLFNQLRFNQ